MNRIDKVIKKFGISRDGEYYKLGISHELTKLIRDRMQEEQAEGVIFRKFAFQEFLFILHLVKFRANYNRDAVGRELAKTITSDHRELTKVVNALESWGLLERSTYKPGSYARGFKVTGFALMDGCDSFKIEVFEAFFQNILKKRDAELNKYNRLEGIRLDSNFDLDAWMKSWKEEKREEYSKLPDAKKEKYLKNLKNSLYAIRDLKAGDLYGFKKNTAENRIYHTISQLPKVIRRNLVDVNGEPMKERDVKSSQPRIAAKVYDRIAMNVFCEDPRQNSNFRDKSKLYFRNQFKDLSNKNLLESFKFEEIFQKLKYELSEFEELTKFDLYEEISRSKNITRDQAKLGYAITVNDAEYKSSQFEGSVVKEYFIENFPHLACFIDFLHDRYICLGDLRFSISAKMAEYESELILGAVLKFRKDFPERNLATVHDSVIVRLSDIDLIEDYLKITYFERGIEFRSEVEYMEQNLEGRTATTEILPDLQQQTKPISPISLQLPQYSSNVGELAENTPKLAQSSRTNVEVPVQSPEVPAQSSRTKWTVDRPSKIRTLKDGRYTVAVKDKNVNSRKGETLDAFRSRCIELGAILA